MIHSKTFVQVASLTLVTAVLITLVVSYRRARAVAYIDSPTPSHVAVILHRLGLDPESLCAAGINTAVTRTVLATPIVRHHDLIIISS